MLKLLFVIILFIIIILFFLKKNIESGNLKKSNFYKKLLVLIIVAAILFFLATSGKFILPQLFNSRGRGSCMKRVQGLNLIHTVEVSNDFYYPDDNKVNVNCIFQIWAKDFRDDVPDESCTDILKYILYQMVKNLEIKEMLICYMNVMYIYL